MLKHSITALLLFQSGLIGKTPNYWETQPVKLYVHNSEMQRRWAWAFLAPHLKEFKGDEQILDIGCGDGKITADLAKFVPQGSVLGIDPTMPMLNWAQKQYHLLEYPNLTFQEGSFLEPKVDKQFDCVVSFCALQHCSDILAGLKQMTELLQPNGKLLILVPAINNPAWMQARLRVQSAPKWAEYWKDYIPRSFLKAEQYRELLKEVNLEQTRVKTTQTKDPFIDREEVINLLRAMVAPLVPGELFIEFLNDWIDEYLRLDPEALGADGEIYVQFSYVTIEGIKGPSIL